MRALQQGTTEKVDARDLVQTCIDQGCASRAASRFEECRTWTWRLCGRADRRGQLVERAPAIIIPEANRLAVDAPSVGSYIFMWEHGSVEDIFTQKGRAAVVLGFPSLVNYSEVPNCAFNRYIEALALDVIALRDIAEGEELTFNYGMTLWFTPA